MTDTLNNKDVLPLVSIIIPVYNAAKTLPQCVASLQSQSYKQLQVLFINDHSSDQSEELIKNLVSSDSRFELFSTSSNSGASTARNKGLEQAKGKYVFFLDADDWLETNAIEKLTSLAESKTADFICTSHVQNFDSSDRKKQDEAPKHDHVFSQPELLTYVRSYLKTPYLHTLFVHCWGKLYLRELIEQHMLRFNEKLSQLEDVHFNFKYLQFCHQVAYKAAHLYHHRIVSNSGSLSTITGTEDNAVDKFLIAYHPVQDYIESLDKEKMIPADKEVAHLFVNTVIITIIRLCKRLIKTPNLKTFSRLNDLVKSPALKARLTHYVPGPGESKMIFYSLKAGSSALVAIAGVIRAYQVTRKK